MNAARSTTGSPPRRGRRRCAAASRRWSRSATSRIARRVTWHDAAHLPHGWECGYLSEVTTRTLLCGDLFTQGGTGGPAVTDRDILGPSEAFRAQMDYFAHAKNARGLLDKLAATGPTTLACMHGSAWQGDGGKLLRALADAVEA